MIEFDLGWRPKIGGLSFVILLLGCLLLLPVECAMAISRPLSQSTPVPRCSTADECLALGMFYYNNDDTSERAPQHFRLVIRTFRGSAQQVETAQYYLASFYQRKYYIEWWKERRSDEAALRTAVREYGKYTDQYYKEGSHTWLGDAFFNLALAYLELGETGSAWNELTKMRDASDLDSRTYVYEIVWSADSSDVVSAELPTRNLADYAMQILSASRNVQSQSTNGDSVKATILQLRKWCQAQKSKSKGK